MMAILLFYLISLFLTGISEKREPEVYPQNYFAPPVVLPVSLSGNFGEPRRLHFHTGLDIRTNGEEGHKVLAAAEGYVSRINVSGAGYGKALYITHPNGYITVYGHLLRFAPEIEARLKKEQYGKESFAVDFNLSAKELPVKKGELIALSGNTGGSGGPHLHFEIRDSLENIINPALFGYRVKDEIKPVVNYLKFYPLNDMKHKSDGYRSKVFLKEGTYRVTGDVVIVNSSQVGVSVNTYDRMTNSESHVGVYKIKMYDGNKMLYEMQMDRFSFHERRYVLSHIDYPIFMNESRKSFHKCFTEPGNRCSIYTQLTDGGTLNLSDRKIHNIRIEVGDVSGNVSAVEFKMKYEENSTTFKEKPLSYTTRFDYEHENEFSNQEIKVRIPQGCLFDQVYWNYKSLPSTDSNIYSKIHQLGNSTTLLFTWFDLAIKAERMTPALAPKALIVYKTGTEPAAPRGGKFENGMVKTRTREFGTYYIRIDTSSPRITPLNVSPGKNMRIYKKLLFRLTDNLSGLSDFDTYIDDQWVITEWDAKSSTLTHTLDQSLTPGNHVFSITAKDERQNTAFYTIKFKM